MPALASPGDKMTPTFRSFIPSLLAVLILGCSGPPDIGSHMSDAAQRTDYPSILPLDALLASRPDTSAAVAFAAPLANRASALRARAAGLRGPIIDASTKSRMNDALARH